jgi:hypothetical protein
MTWLTWRQQRAEAVFSLGLIAALGVFVAISGLHMRDAFGQLGLAHCDSGSTGAACGSAVASFNHRFASIGTLLGWLNFLPAVIGIVFAVPLVLELEHGTYRLSWTQSVTRRHWIAAKLAGAVVAVVAATLVLTVLITWLRGPLDQIDGRWESNSAFNFEGIAPLGYALFALALALALGAITRRVSIVVGGGLIGFLALRLPIQFWVREHYFPPVHRALSGSSQGPNVAKDWVLTENFSNLKTVNASLHARSQACFSEPHAALVGCLRRLGFTETITYQPAARFWIFQGIEFGLFATLATALLMLTAWWIRRRVT